MTPDGRGSVSKLILSSSPDDDDDECIAMMIFGPERRLAYCHPCRSTNWTPIGDLYGYYPNGVMFARSYYDFVYSSTQKLFFCISNCGFECWDPSDPLSPRINLSWQVSFMNLNGQCELLEEKLIESAPYQERLIRSTHYPDIQRSVSLVYAEQYNQLFLVMQCVMARMSPDGSYVRPIYLGKYRGWVDRFPYRTVGLDAYKIDLGGVVKPQYMEGSLDGLAMFIGKNHSIAMSVTPESKLISSNCIYFTDSSCFYFPPSSFYGGHDIGIFDYANRTISPCYYFPLDINSIKRIVPTPMWFTPCVSRPH